MNITDLNSYPIEDLNLQEVDKLRNRVRVVVEDETLDQIIEVDGTYTYIGYTVCGGQTDQPIWRIKRIDESVAGTTSIGWANGNSKFAHVWDDRAALDYTN